MFSRWILLYCLPLLTLESAQLPDGRITFGVPEAGTQEPKPARAELNWDYKPTRWGMYDVEVEGSFQGKLRIEIANKRFTVSRPGNVGRVYIAKAEPFKIDLRAEEGSSTSGIESLTLIPAREGPPIIQDGDVITLQAAEAITHSVTMRYEPATNKNCLGYWVNTNDFAEWRFNVSTPGDYDVELWQGCGKGQGGSDVQLELRSEKALLQTFDFRVEETGHFQIFIPRKIGRAKFAEPGDYSLWVKPRRKQAGAIMDVRQLVLRKAERQAGVDFPGKRSLWYGFNRFDFEVEGKLVSVVAPDVEAPSRPWLWEGEFFGHKPNPDLALLGRGFHVVYMSVPDMLGSPRAVAYWDHCYQTLTAKFGFARKVALTGLSRGGLYCYNWAVANPDKTACIYADAPVCDFKSWPGAFGKGKRSDRDWNLVLEGYGFHSDADARAYSKNPVDNLGPLAEAKVPLLHVFGDADEVVPWEENTGLLAERYGKLGGSITLIRKPGVQHHPHGLDDSTPIVDFIWNHAADASAKDWLSSHGGGPLDRSMRPLIRKLGTIDLDLVETTPIVLSNRLWRFEWVRQGTGQQYWDNQRQTNYFRFRDAETGETTPPFADGHEFGSAFVHDGTVYVTGTEGRSRVNIFSTHDLRHWEKWPALDDSRYGVFNTSLCKSEDDFVLMFEIDRPRDEAGVPFTARFARSKDLRTWRLTPPECAYARDRYTAPHALRWHDGWFYDFFLEAHEGYEMRVVRSRDLVVWESSPLNPVLRNSAFDKVIANSALTDAQRTRIALAINLNNSDIDFCEWQGRLTINYSWGNQQGTEHLASAVYDGTLAQFLRGWFPR